MRKVMLYTIQGNTKDYSDFLQTNYSLNESIQVKAMHKQNWKPFDMEKFVIPEFELARSDTGKKNFQHDISTHESPFYIFSENAVEALKDILEPRGQFLPIINPSKRKKFIGYYPTNAIKGLVDLEKSGIYDLSLNFETDNLKFRENIAIDEYMFCISESRNCILFTEKFKERVEETKLNSFSFLSVDVDFV